jgi:tubulin--tyrosine ligase
MALLRSGGTPPTSSQGERGESGNSPSAIDSDNRVGGVASSSNGSNSQIHLTNAARDCAKKNGWICQEYMLTPLLVAGRKFDIRIFVIIRHTKKGNKLDAFYFKEGYVRTSCKKYSLNSLKDRECHLTNDAIQKKSKSYGKFEGANKLSLSEWQETIVKDYPHAPPNVVGDVVIPEIKKLCGLTITAASKRLCDTNIAQSFELLGYDFMVDSDFKSTLIEINSNPAMEFCCPLLEKLLTNLMENVFKAGPDYFFPPPIPEERTRNTAAACQALEEEENLLTQIYSSSSSTGSS